MTTIIPLQKNDETVTTQFPIGAIEELGLLKMDFGPEKLNRDTGRLQSGGKKHRKAGGYEKFRWMIRWCVK
ncbi:MAG: hypothetical protein ACLT0Y_06010 [Christensenellales bacterium]